MPSGTPPARTLPTRTIALVGLVLLAFLGLGLLVVGTKDGDSDKESSREDTSDSKAEDGEGASDDDPGLARREAEDPMAVGDPDAPVVVVEYSDFRCPFCARFTRETMPKLIEEYVDAGLVRYEMRDMPLFGDESLDAAIAGRAAARQEFLTAVHADAPDKGHPPMPRKKLIAYAEEAGVDDIDRFADDLDDETLRDQVEADVVQAQGIGVNSVPFFAVDAYAVSGAQPWEVFEEVIEERLDAHGVERD